MRILLVAGVLIGALTHAAPAAAGCMATAGLAPPPAGTAPGEAWTAEITILQHGINPLPNARDAEPKVTIVHQETGKKQAFTARPSDPARGRYEATVIFPFGGTWTYEVFDDFPEAQCARTHKFGAVEIGGPTAASGSGGGGFPLWPLIAGLGMVLSAACAFVYRSRRNGSRLRTAT
ncbi:MAG: hypothetical protein ACRDKU_04475 [Gaiellaceae bacterium]